MNYVLCSHFPVQKISTTYKQVNIYVLTFLKSNLPKIVFSQFKVITPFILTILHSMASQYPIFDNLTISVCWMNEYAVYYGNMRQVALFLMHLRRRSFDINKQSKMHFNKLNEKNVLVN